jgi:hypothetical protein
MPARFFKPQTFVQLSTDSGNTANFGRFFQMFPQGIPCIHSFCTQPPRFLLEGETALSQSSEQTQRYLLDALPEHCGSWRLLAILEGELPGGFPRCVLGHTLVARALRPPQRVLHTRQDWPLAVAVPQAEPRGLLCGWRPGGWVSVVLLRERALISRPRLAAWGGQTEDTQNNAARVAGSGCIFLATSPDGVVISPFFRLYFQDKLGRKLWSVPTAGCG